MAPADVAAASATLGGPEAPKLPTRRKYKASDLPLTAAQRSSIDGLVTAVKRKGEFDSLRKRVWSQFDEGVRIPCTWGCLRPLISRIGRQI